MNNNRPVQIKVDYEKGSRPTISTYLDKVVSLTTRARLFFFNLRGGNALKVEIIGEDKFKDAEPKPRCMIHIINGIILPYNPGADKIFFLRLTGFT